MTISLEQLAEILESDPSQVKWLNSTVERIRQTQTPPDLQHLIEEMLEARIITRFQSQMLLEGSDLLIGNYVLIDKIGEGGMGTVYLARHRHMGRMVALKIIRRDRISVAGAIDRFHREIRVASELRHPNVVTSFDAGEYDGSLYLVMELIKGVDLKRRIETKGVMPIPLALDTMRQAASGLAYLHSQKLVHRDIKPSNLMLDHQGVVKILDLGLSRMIEWSDAMQAEMCYDITSTGEVTGSVDFMPPEQFVNARSVDARADIYSLGCTFYWLLTGRAPFPGNTPGAKVVAHRESAIPRLSDVLPDVPQPLEQLLERLLAKDPKSRFADAQSLIAEINALGILASTQNDCLLRVSSVSPLNETETMIRDDIPSSLKPEPTSLQAALTTEVSGQLTATESRPRTRNRNLLVFGCFLGLGVLSTGLFMKFGTKNATQVGDFRRLYDIELTSVDRNKDGNFKGNNPTSPKPSDIAATIPWGLPPDAPAPAIAPFDAEQAKKHQEEWAQYLNVPVEYENSIGMKFRLIPPGEFLMGITLDYFTKTDTDLARHGADSERFHTLLKTELPQHKVRLTNPIYFGIHEVTQQNYETIMGTNPSFFSTTGQFNDQVIDLDTRPFPVDGISWNNAAEFCMKLSEKEGRTPAYLLDSTTMIPVTGTGYRLPTESEWEFSCRAGTTTEFWTGDSHDDVNMAGWFIQNSDGRPHPVGQLKANPFGLHDVHGNVFEFTQDGWDNETYQKNAVRSPAINPTGGLPTASQRAFRGGNWHDYPFFGRSSARLSFGADDISHIGFRVVLPVIPVK